MRAHLYWGSVTVLVLASTAVCGQQAQLQIDDTGQVIANHQQHRAKNGDKITWQRKKGASKSWYVRFAESPCGEGSEFRSDGQAKTCTISVACNETDQSGCKSYNYSSATSPNSDLHDPVIIVGR